MPVSFQPFNFTQVEPGKTWLFIGKRGSGKTTTLLDVLYHTRSITDVPFVMCPTVKTLQQYRRHIPTMLTQKSTCDLDKLQTIMTLCSNMVEKEKNRNVTIITDDTMFDAKPMRSKQMRELHMNGRHLKCTYFNAIQWCMDMVPAMRSQIDYVVCMYEPNPKYRKKLHENFFSILPYKDFNKTFLALTSNYGAIVLDNTKQDRALNEYIFFHRVLKQDLTRDFKIGMPIFWKFNRLLTNHKKRAKIKQYLAQVKQKKDPAAVDVEIQFSCLK